MKTMTLTAVPPQNADDDQDELQAQTASMKGRRRVQPKTAALPIGVYFAGPVEVKGVGIKEAGVVSMSIVSLVMPDFVPSELLENKDKFERAGDENKPLRLYVFPLVDPPKADIVHSLDAEDSFLAEVTVTKQIWKYEIAGGYMWQMSFCMPIPTIISEDGGIDEDAARIADWALNLGSCHVILVDPKAA